MFEILAFVIIFILIIVNLFLLFHFSGLLFSILYSGIPTVGTNLEDLYLLKDNFDFEKDLKIIDIGCGNGKVLRFLNNYFHFSRLDGFDVNFSSIFFGKLINLFKGYNDINLYNKNFKNIDLSKYDYVYMYLLKNFIDEEELISNLSKGTILISTGFKIESKDPFKIINNKYGRERIYIYEI